jgi:hypothetical protein
MKIYSEKKDKRRFFSSISASVWKQRIGTDIESESIRASCSSIPRREFFFFKKREKTKGGDRKFHK